VSNESILSDSLVLQLQILRRLVGSRLSLWSVGTTRGRLLGNGSEFVEHRQYVPGDNIRSLDWFATARSGSPVVRVCRKEEDSLVHLFLDTSGSLGCGSPPKLQSAKTLIAAIGYLGLLVGHRVQLLLPDAESPSGPLRQSPIRRGAQAAPQLVHDLKPLRAAGATRLDLWLTALNARSSTPARIVVVSDLLQLEDFSPALAELMARGHELLLVQLYDANEYQVANPDGSRLTASAIFEDSETREHASLHLDAETIAGFQARFRNRVDTTNAWCQATGARFALVASNEPPLSTLYRLLLPSTPYAFPQSPHA
jgi:uncharacterized protein (DUF58 family)